MTVIRDFEKEKKDMIEEVKRLALETTLTKAEVLAERSRIYDATMEMLAAEKKQKEVLNKNQNN